MIFEGVTPKVPTWPPTVVLSGRASSVSGKPNAKWEKSQCACSRSASAASRCNQRAADAGADGHRGPAQGAGRRRLPQRPASGRRLVRPRRRQAHEPGRPRHEAAGHARPRECRRGGGARSGRQGRQGRRSACWPIRGSAAARAGRASAARTISAAPCAASACSPTAAMPTT